MEISAATALIWLPFVLPIGIWVAWNDMAFMKIPNVAVGALLAIFMVVGLFALPFTDYLWRYAHFAVVLAVGFVLNMIRALGAGDAKFAAAMAPLIDLGDVAVVATLGAGLLIAAFVTHRGAKRLKPVRDAFPDWESWTRRDFPMGLALGSTLIGYMVLGAIYGP